MSNPRRTFTAQLNADVTGEFTTARKITHAVALLGPEGWKIADWFASQRAAETNGRGYIRCNPGKVLDYRVVRAFPKAP